MQSILERSRREKGITLREMSERTGIHFTKISRQERRREPLFPRDIQRYADFFGIEPGKIADESGFARIAGLTEISKMNLSSVNHWLEILLYLIEGGVKEEGGIFLRIYDREIPTIIKAVQMSKTLVEKQLAESQAIHLLQKVMYFYLRDCTRPDEISPLLEEILDDIEAFLADIEAEGGMHCENKCSPLSARCGRNCFVLSTEPRENGPRLHDSAEDGYSIHFEKETQQRAK